THGRAYCARAGRFRGDASARARERFRDRVGVRSRVSTNQRSVRSRRVAAQRLSDEAFVRARLGLYAWAPSRRSALRRGRDSRARVSRLERRSMEMRAGIPERRGALRAHRRAAARVSRFERRSMDVRPRLSQGRRVLHPDQRAVERIPDERFLWAGLGVRTRLSGERRNVPDGGGSREWLLRRRFLWSRMGMQSRVRGGRRRVCCSPGAGQRASRLLRTWVGLRSALSPRARRLRFALTLIARCAARAGRSTENQVTLLARG